MKVLLGTQELWDIVETGYEEPAEEVTLTTAQTTKLNENRRKDRRALLMINQTVTETVFQRITVAETSKKAWDILFTSYKGDDKVKMVRLQSKSNRYNAWIKDEKGCLLGDHGVAMRE